MNGQLVIVKLGGSLFDGIVDTANRTLDDCERRLRSLPGQTKVLIAGGGKKVDQLRQQYQKGLIDEETAHWQAIHRMDENTKKLAHQLNLHLIDDLRLHVSTLGKVQGQEASRQPELLCMMVKVFLRQDDTRADHLPHSWDVTSDSIAAHIAARHGAELILLKSCPVPASDEKYDWPSLAAAGIVDDYFPRVAAKVRSITLETLSFPFVRV